MGFFMNRIWGVCAVLLALVLSGCATIVSGGQQSISISSDPSEAAVKIIDSNGAVVFDSRTPTTATLKKGQGFFKGASYRLVVEKSGYKSQEILLQSDMNVGWYVVGNFFFGGLIGWLIIDPSSGAMWTLSPESVNAKLGQETSFIHQKDGLTIVLRKDVPAGMVPLLRPL